ncbi:MAG: oligopeptide transporter, OPT family [Acidobacteria bacterium]|nr:oligopeptide transporter, OPT family [Acidobacteriota bacterium]
MAAEAKPTTANAAETHKPYISAATFIPEFTPRAVLLGAVFGIIFGASTVYLGLKTGLTVSASIPIAVLSITLLRMLGRSTILENNIVQTTGSAGESIAGGIVFTIPALLILGLDLDVLRTTLIALTGGLLGTLLMIPLRRSLIVKEHGNLPYPEGTACAEVLVAGEKGGSDAKTVFLGFGVGLVYKFLMLGLKFWKDVPAKVLTWYQNARIAAEISPELLGVGYIIGPRTASYMLGGGVIAALVMVPLVKFFGAGLTTNIFPAEPGELISNMSAGQVFDRYVRYIAAGAVATGGIISLLRSLPTIAKAFSAGVKDFSGAGGGNTQERTERDIPIAQALLGVLIVAGLIWGLPQLQVDLLSTVLILIFGFFFVTVSSRITGQIGTSANPISGMTIAALLFTSLIYLGLGRSGAEWRVVALTVGAVICVAAANAGGTSQDLKTGFLVGGTPKFQQLGLIIGVIASATVVGWTLLFLNDSYQNILPRLYPNYTANSAALGEVWNGRLKPEDGKTYRTLRLTVAEDAGDGKSKIPAGKYLVGDDNKIHYLVNPGVGGKPEGLSDNKLGALKDQSFTPGAGEVKLIGDARGLDDKIYREVSIMNEGRERKLLLDEAGKPRYEIDEINKLEAPKAALMGILVDGVLTRRLPWVLILIGMFISITLEILGIHALPVAVGIYLPISTSATIFAGGMVRALINKLMKSDKQESLSEEETGKGVLLSSGLIAGGAIGGLVVSVARIVLENMQNKPGKGEALLGIGDGSFISAGPWSNVFALIIFGGLVGFVISVARKRST